jgi:hypothetical protein
LGQGRAIYVIRARVKYGRDGKHAQLKLNAREKTLGAAAGEKLEDFETHFRIKWAFKD